MLNIYVGNLPFSCGDEELRELFGRFGSVSRASIITDRETDRSRGFGFVEMENEEEGKKAIEELNGSELDGRNLNINEARPRGEGGGGRGGGGGGYGGGGGGGGGRW